MELEDRQLFKLATKEANNLWKNSNFKQESDYNKTITTNSLKGCKNTFKSNFIKGFIKGFRIKST